MVQRTSERVGIQGPGAGEVNTQGPGQVSPKNVQGVFSTQVASPTAPTPVPAFEMNKMLLDVLKVSGDVVNKKIDNERQLAYLRGAAAVGTGVTEDELQSSILTRDWAKAGFRDTQGRLAVADFKASMAAELPKNRSQSPKAYEQVLGQYRDRLFPMLDGMSLKARSELFPELLAAEHAIIRKHGTEHAAYQVEMIQKGIQVGASQTIAELTATQGDPLSYQAATASTYAWARANIMNNPNLPEEARNTMIGQFIEANVDAGNMALYEMFKTMPGMDIGDGTMVPVISLLPLEQQTKLSKAYETGKNKNKSSLTESWYNNYRDIMLSSDNGNHLLSSNEFDAYLEQGVQLGAKTREQATTESRSYAKSLKEAYTSSAASAAYAAGDVPGIKELGSTPEQQAKYMTQTMLAQGATGVQVAEAQLKHGMTTGIEAAYTEAAQLLQPAINAGMTSIEGEVPAYAADAFDVLTKTMEKYTSESQGTAMTALMSVMTDEQALYMQRVWDNMKTSGGKATVADAMKSARELRNKEANMGEPARLAAMSAARKENQELVTGVDSTNKLTAYLRKRIPFMTPLGDSGLEPVRNWFGESAGESKQLEEIRGHIADELEAATRRAPMSKPAARMQQAIAKVQARTIPIDGVGNLILPMGTNVTEFFGVKEETPTWQIAKAVRNKLPEEAFDPGNVTHFSAVDGQVGVQVYNKRGDPNQVNPIAFTSPDKMQEEIAKVHDEYHKEASEQFGAGIKRKGKDGSEVQFSGSNSWNIRPDVALAVRETLVNFEDVTHTPYADGEYNSGGVGINEQHIGKKQWMYKVGPDGRISNEEISRSFMGASDEFMGMAVQTAKKWDMDMNEVHTMSLLTSMLYQGRGGMERVLLAIQSGDEDAAVAAIRQSSAWKYSGKPTGTEDTPRRRWYEQTARNIVRKSRG